MTRHGNGSIRSVAAASCASASSCKSSRRTELDSLLRLPAVDVAERLGAMLETERRPHYRCRDYLKEPRRPSSSASSSHSRRSLAGRSPGRRRRTNTAAEGREQAIDPAARARIVRWLYDCADYLELSRECVAVAASLVDRFVSSADDLRGSGGDGMTKKERRHRRAARDARRDAASYQLLSVAALLIASKQVDGHRAGGTADADVLSRLGRGSCTADEIVDAEALLLDALDWRVCGPTALGMAGHLIALLASSGGRGERRGGEDRLASVADFARLQVELAVADYAASTSRLPSEVALAAVLNAVDLLDFSSREVRSFGRALLDATGMDVRSRTIAAARDELHRVFDRQSDGIASRAAATKKGSSSRGGDGSVPSATARSGGGGRGGAECATTPRSSRSRRRGGRGSRPRPSPTGVVVGIGARAKLEP